VTEEAGCREVPYAESPAPYTVVRVSARCVITAVAFGLQEVDVAYPSFSSWPPAPGSSVTRVSVSVVPDGAYVLYGRVTQAGVPLPSARVVLASEPDHPVAITDGDGRYMFAPVAGDVIVRADMQGYASREQRVALSHHERLDLALQLEGEPTGIDGWYSLTFTASGECSLPADVRQRSYGARVTQEDRPADPWWGGPYTEVTASLSGAVFVSARRTISGVREGDAVTFNLPAAVHEIGLAELIQPSKELHYTGRIDATVSPRRIEGPFVGTMRLIDQASRATLAECASANHRVALTR
jgi:hypothetical protein